MNAVRNIINVSWLFTLSRLNCGASREKNVQYVQFICSYRVASVNFTITQAHRVKIYKPTA